MIGIISIDGNYPDNPKSFEELLLPDNLSEASGWSFVARPASPSSPSKISPSPSGVGDVQQRVLSIRKHLREGLEYLRAQEKGLHEAITAVEGMGNLVNRRDQGLYPRISESTLQEEFEILRVQLEGIRLRKFFQKPLYGNGATPPLRIHTSLWDTPRCEEVSIADLESLSLRLIYWGRVAGEGLQPPIHAKTIEDALRHLLETALKNQSEQDRLRNLFKSLADAACVSANSGSSEEIPSHSLEHNGKATATDVDPVTTPSGDILSRLRAWVQKFLPNQHSPKCINKNFHHNQDAAS